MVALKFLLIFVLYVHPAFSPVPRGRGSQGNLSSSEPLPAVSVRLAVLQGNSCSCLLGSMESLPPRGMGKLHGPCPFIFEVLHGVIVVVTVPSTSSPVAVQQLEMLK